MAMPGGYNVAASRESVRQALRDPDAVLRCLPGAGRFARLSENVLTGTAQFAARNLDVRIEISPDAQADSGVIALTDQGNPGGIETCNIHAALSDQGNGASLIQYGLEPGPDGAPKEPIPGSLQDAALELADGFFAELARTSGGSVASSDMLTTPGSPGNAPADEPSGAHSAAPRNGIGPSVWIAVLVLILALVLWAIL